jgi:hypothetical protein
MIKVYMDDERVTPTGWIRTYTVEQTIALLEARIVSHLSLDNDLGEDLEGYFVIDWLEEAIYNDINFPLPEVTIHSANASRVQYMQRALESIKRIRNRQYGGI